MTQVLSGGHDQILRSNEFKGQMRGTERKGKETAMVKLAANNLEIYNSDAQA